MFPSLNTIREIYRPVAALAHLVDSIHGNALLATEQVLQKQFSILDIHVSLINSSEPISSLFGFLV